MIKFKPWPGMVFVLLAANMVIVGVTIVAAMVSYSPIEPDYYRRAVEWDQVKSLRPAPAAWSVAATRRQGTLRLTVRDAHDKPPKAGVAVTAQVEGTPGSAPSDLRLEPAGPGEFDAPWPANAGSLRVVIVSGTAVVVLQVPLPEAGP